MSIWSSERPMVSSAIASCPVRPLSYLPGGCFLTLTIVFLRALDYFQGIFFLTTNRVGHFDEAFMSRIHVSLGYEKLGNDARAKIWDNLFKKLGDDHKRGGLEINYEYHAKSYVKSKEVQDLQWNGREIRNGESQASYAQLIATD
jgi:hypothetical protein